MDLSPLDRHEKIVLQFSGGKDSIACLLLLRAHLHRITVLWLNTGDPLPEHATQMARVRELAPHFIQIDTDVERSFGTDGWPADVLPIRNERQTQFLTQQERLPLQSFMACCYNNLMQPMHAATLATGATLVIRGQKNADSHKSPLQSGAVMAGIEYWFPVEAWTDDQVLDYIGNTDLLPAHFERHHTSLDCWACTAYLGEHQWKQPYLERHHPERAATVRHRLALIRNEILSDMKHMEVSNG